MAQPIWKVIWQVSLINKYQNKFSAIIQSKDIDLKELRARAPQTNLGVNVYISFLCHSQKLKLGQLSLRGQSLMQGKPIPSNEKEWVVDNSQQASTNICCAMWMEKYPKPLSVCFSLYVIFNITKLWKWRICFMCIGREGHGCCY